VGPTFAKGHVKGAINIPHGVDGHWMHEYPKAALFVVYCAGPHCNGANKAAVRLPDSTAGEDDDRRSQGWLMRFTLTAASEAVA
jgi:rhodanese-related sulfurtransferase